MKSITQMSDEQQHERKISNITPTDPYAGYSNTAKAEEPGEVPVQVEASLGEFLSVLASKAFTEVRKETARIAEENGLTELNSQIMFPESIAEIRSMLTNVVASAGKGDFNKAAEQMAAAVFSAMVLGHILDEESGGRFGFNFARKLEGEVRHE